MTIFFTGCTHFGHANILKLAQRPFASMEEMNEILVERWNAVVDPDDTVYHLGDFSWRDPSSWWSRLNGRKHLVLGNHDDETRIRASCPSAVSIQNYLTLKEGAHRFVLFHYPINDWDGRWRGSIHLHAHTHSPQRRNPNLPYMVDDDGDGRAVLAPNYPAAQSCNRFNVGVDATDFTPIAIEDILSQANEATPSA